MFENYLYLNLSLVFIFSRSSSRDGATGVRVIANGSSCWEFVVRPLDPVLVLV